MDWKKGKDKETEKMDLLKTKVVMTYKNKKSNSQKIARPFSIDNSIANISLYVF